MDPVASWFLLLSLCLFLVAAIAWVADWWDARR